MLHLYDSSVYIVGKKGTQVIEITNDAEALKLNELQWMNALDHVYFSNLSQSNSIQIQAKRFLKRRRSCLVEGSQITDTVFEGRKVDLRIGLKPSFVRIKKSRKNVPFVRRPLVRNPTIFHSFLEFRKSGSYMPGLFTEFLTERFTS